MNFIDIGYWWAGNTGLILDISKMESWNHIGCTANILNIVIKDTYSCIHQQKHAFFYDGTALWRVPKLVLFFFEIGFKKVLKRSYFSFAQSCRNPVNRPGDLDLETTQRHLPWKSANSVGRCMKWWSLNAPPMAGPAPSATGRTILLWSAPRRWILYIYRKTSNIRRTLAGNKIVDHSDVVGASPVGAAPTTSSFSTWHLASAKTVARQYENLLSVEIWCDLY